MIQSRHASPLRYPGGKAFLAKEFTRILKCIGSQKPTYVEPYAGGAGAALALLFSDKVKRIVINDLDTSIYSFWISARDYSRKFAKKIIETPVTVEEWKRQRKIYFDKNASVFDRGFATFFLNRTNRSGVMNAGPIGGDAQRGNFKIDARFNKKDLANRILQIGKYKKRITVLNEDGIKVAKKYLSKRAFIYLDPPYFVQGAMLYYSHYKESDHKVLANLLNTNPEKLWVLTYDERAKIRDLYSNRTRRRLSLRYRVRGSRKARELVILSDALSV